jgi:hypothetical protein
VDAAVEKHWKDIGCRCKHWVTCRHAVATAAFLKNL